MQSNQPICELFLKHGLLSIQEAKTLLEKANASGMRFDQYLVKTKRLSEEETLKVIAQSLNIPYVDLEVEGVDPQLFNQLPKEYIIKYSVFPIRLEGDDLTVAVSDPFNLSSVNSIRFFFKNHIKLVVAQKSQMDKIMEYEANRQNTSHALKAMEVELQTNGEIRNIEELAEEDVANAPAVKLADAIIKEAVTIGASDIHIEPYEEVVRVRYRIDGMLMDATSFTKKYYPAILTRYKIMAQLNIAERRVPQDGRIRLEINTIDYDFRVSTLPTVHGEKIVIRIFDNTTRQFEIPQLGFLEKEEKLIYNIISQPHGIVLVTGPTGSGKSTTLYAFLKELNKANVNIITVEDPVENEIEGINQTQVNVKANLTFASAMRSILRQDPNIIMIGEIRDEETAQIAIRAAITGHLVLSTLHTNDAPGAVNRLVDMGVPAYLVADATTGVIAQRLVRILCPHCKKEAITSKTEMELLGIDQPTTIYHPVGCGACHGTGYRGRMGIHEVMAVDYQLTKLIEQHATSDIIRAKAIENGMLTLWDTCKENVLLGKTSLQELSSLSTIDKNRS